MTDATGNAQNGGNSSEKRAQERHGFGTFKGVYVPSILTILGVIMFLRLGWVLGNVGLPETLLIVTISTGITFLTGLSISALSTNMKVGGGGAYYIISRSLGIEAGAAVGLPLFLAQAVGISFYIAGFSESLVGTVPSLAAIPHAEKIIGVITLLALTALAYISADLALKSQFIILAAIAASLVSFFLGGPPAESSMGAIALAEPASFWIVFAVFFPAVTGIEAGLAMSGDLKNPAKSLPTGTLAAILTGYAVYMVIPIYLAGIVSSPETLRSNPLIMRDVAAVPSLIMLGVFGATLSSALGALLGAPRTLQALARDGVIPRILGRGHGPSQEPRIATGVSFLVGLAGVLLGDLNLIAPILAMFFLTSYGVLNISSGFEGMIGSASWRPTFKVHWMFSMIGAFGCFAVMFMINAGATFVALFVSATVFWLMQRRQLNAHWGDMRYGLLMLLARYAIYGMASRKPDERSWSPNILVLSGSPTSRWYLVELADALSHGKGFLTIATVLPRNSTTERSESIQATIADYLSKRAVPALVTVKIADDPLSGAREIVRTYGFGPLQPNTFLLGETEVHENFTEYASLIGRVYSTRRNLVIVREGRMPTSFGNERRIEVWWGRERKNAGLMLALGYLLGSSPEWAGASLALKTIVKTSEEKTDALKRLRVFLDEGRLEATAEVVVSQTDPFETIRKSSQGASIVFIGMREPGEEESPEQFSQYYADLLKKTDGMPPTALVLASEKIEFHRIFQ